MNHEISQFELQKGAIENTWQVYGYRLLDEYGKRLSHPMFH
jgi:hypothetical protein